MYKLTLIGSTEASFNTFNELCEENTRQMIKAVKIKCYPLENVNCYTLPYESTEWYSELSTGGFLISLKCVLVWPGNFSTNGHDFLETHLSTSSSSSSYSSSRVYNFFVSQEICRSDHHYHYTTAGSNNLNQHTEHAQLHQEIQIIATPSLSFSLSLCMVKLIESSTRANDRVIVQ